MLEVEPRQQRDVQPAARRRFTQQQIIDIALPQKKGHLIGSNNLEGLTSYTVTLHHNHYKDLQDRMPRLRGGDVHAYNLYRRQLERAHREGDARRHRRGESFARQRARARLTTSASRRKASISTEGGAVQVEDSVFFGVLTPFRNNQTDVNNPAYTGAIRGIDIQHILLASDTQFMPATSQQATFTDRGFLWASWQGDSDDPHSSLGPTQAPQIPFAWHNGTPMYLITMDPVATLPALLTGPQGAGAGKIGMTTQQWLASLTNGWCRVAKLAKRLFASFAARHQRSFEDGRARLVRVGRQARLATAPALPPLRPRCPPGRNLEAFQPRGTFRRMLRRRIAC